VYPPVSAPIAAEGKASVGALASEAVPPEARETSGNGALQRELELARDQIADLRNERDRLLKIIEEQAGAVRVLTDQRQPAPPQTGFWRFLRRHKI
jgi:hypothetical protein